MSIKSRMRDSIIPASYLSGVRGNLRGLLARSIIDTTPPAQPPVFPATGLLEVDKHYASRLCLRLIGILGMRPYLLDELMLMVSAFIHHRPELVVDVGTNVGKSARLWWELAQSSETGAEIYTIDIMDPAHPEYPAMNLGAFIKGTGVIQRIGDSYEVADELINSNQSVSTLLFLDGSHDYEIVRRDLELAHKLERGCVLVHDTMYQPGSKYNHGPYEAVDDFLKTYPAHQIIQTHAGLPGLTYIGLNRNIKT